MKLLLPVVLPEDIEQLRAVLTVPIEFYAGIELESWYSSFGPYEDLNRMSAFRKTANMNGIDAVSLLKRAAGNNELYVTLNASSYSQRQQAFLRDVIAVLAKIKVTGVIVGDPHLADTILHYGLKPVASTMLGIYNADLARWCKALGFRRLILPRDLTLQEISDIVAAVPDVEYECFIMRNGCRYSDSNCLARHGDQYGAICTSLDRYRTIYGGMASRSFKAHDAMVFNHQSFSKVFHKETCGICAIWDLARIGISAGKVVGRADGIKSILTDASLLNRNIDIAKRCRSREEYLTEMEYPHHYDAICFQGCSCYYPEVRYGRKEDGYASLPLCSI